MLAFLLILTSSFTFLVGEIKQWCFWWWCKLFLNGFYWVLFDAK